MIKRDDILRLKRELENDNFLTAYYGNTLEVYEEKYLIITIDFEKGTIRFGLKPKRLEDHPRLSYLMGRIYGTLWGKEEEKKYRLVMPLELNDKNCLTLNKDNGNYFLSTIRIENFEFKKYFTEREIESMPKSWSGFFIKEEVL